jgi:hypothetical protein
MGLGFQTASAQERAMKKTDLCRLLLAIWIRVLRLQIETFESMDENQLR